MAKPTPPPTFEDWWHKGIVLGPDQSAMKQQARAAWDAREPESAALREALRRSLEGWHQHCGEIRRPHMHRGVDCDLPHECDCGGDEALDAARALAWPDGPIAARRALLARQPAEPKATSKEEETR